MFGSPFAFIRKHTVVGTVSLWLISVFSVSSNDRDQDDK